MRTNAYGPCIRFRSIDSPLTVAVQFLFRTQFRLPSPVGRCITLPHFILWFVVGLRIPTTRTAATTVYDPDVPTLTLGVWTTCSTDGPHSLSPLPVG